ncbi:hypothetical protein TRIUR3_00439 [Triticum urartu]|uniref:Uncharacterized protein n=1 Tax=Triticum urartu TaxID=4572 RepID=M8AVB8_TRIUA|nr:hypothetical protein TRIUR3_00439 [Triticum urartu]
MARNGALLRVNADRSSTSFWRSWSESAALKAALLRATTDRPSTSSHPGDLGVRAWLSTLHCYAPPPTDRAPQVILAILDESAALKAALLRVTTDRQGTSNHSGDPGVRARLSRLHCYASPPTDRAPQTILVILELERGSQGCTATRHLRQTEHQKSFWCSWSESVALNAALLCVTTVDLLVFRVATVVRGTTFLELRWQRELVRGPLPLENTVVREAGAPEWNRGGAVLHAVPAGRQGTARGRPPQGGIETGTAGTGSATE